MADLKHTPLHALHVALGARMVPFAGYEMPVQYEGIIAEHEHTRENVSLFDVSHMGQLWLVGPDVETVARALERLVPADILGLKPGQQRYTQLTNENGGIIDDLMVTRPAEHDDRLYLVVNAARTAVDCDWIRRHLPPNVRLELWEGRALLALQGPRAEAVLAPLFPQVKDLAFMQAAEGEMAGVPVRVSRSGYTGEDGFEISVPAAHALDIARILLDRPGVKPAGLGARDTLRLEAGLCLYGHDIDESTSPVEAALTWSIGRRRREEGGFPGAVRILQEIAEGPARRRVGLAPESRAPAREGTRVFRPGTDEEIGVVTSGGFGPTVGAPVAMGYVRTDMAKKDTPVELEVRGRRLPARVTSPVFVPHRYRR